MGLMTNRKRWAMTEDILFMVKSEGHKDYWLEADELGATHVLITVEDYNGLLDEAVLLLKKLQESEIACDVMRARGWVGDE